ncbi:MAG: hypothetical protein JJT75_13085 [Opitutales bacterium]|nr:hypothetical protein [Opitutales bacterium]MCH8540185.1 hypothetical protein [Opitutales bacterium]
MRFSRSLPGFFLFSLAFLITPFAKGENASEDVEAKARQEALASIVEKENRLLRLREGWQEELEDEAREDRFQKLADEYDEFVAEHPDYVPGLVAYGLFLDRLGYHEEAAGYFVEANRRDPNIPMVKNQLGNYTRSREDFKTALGYYLAASELDPSQPLYHFQVGHLLLEQREHFENQDLLETKELEGQMMAALRKAWALDPSEPQYGYHLGLAYNDLQDPAWNEALAHWEEMESQVIEEFDRQLMRLHQARVLVHLTKYEQAQDILETITEENLLHHRDRVWELLP